MLGSARFLRRCAAGLGGLSPDWRAMLAILAVVVAANAPVLFAFSDPNPLGPRSELVSGVTAGPLPGEATIDPNDGFISQALGHRAALDLLHLRLPWWDPYEGTGAPLAGGMTSAAFFPPTLLTVFSNGQIYERVLLEIVAGLSVYLLLRRISLSRRACVPSAIAFALNGTFAWFAITPINAVAVLPALLLGVELAYSRSVSGRRGGWWLIAVAGAVSLYAGFPEVAYIDGLLCLCWFAWRCGCLRGKPLRAFAGKAASGAIVGVLLSAPLLLAFFDYLAEAELGSHSGSAVGMVHLPTPALSQLMLPYVYGPIFAFGDTKLTLTTIWGEVGGYLSTSLLLFALLGLVSTGRRGLRLLLLAWIVLALARMYAKPPLLGDLVGLLPEMSRVAFFRYGFPSVELAVVVLAGLGLDELTRASPSRRRSAIVASASLAVVTLAALEARPLAHRLGSGSAVIPTWTGQSPGGRRSFSPRRPSCSSGARAPASGWPQCSSLETPSCCSCCRKPLRRVA
jgi:hypothetical protein